MTSYRQAGVDLEGADRHTENIASPVTATWTKDVVGGFGGFAAGVRLPEGYDDPVLMMSTDGVGTKLEVARRTGLWSGVGHDLVAMCVDDLAAAGASPLGFVDYLAVGALQEERDKAIVASVADACSVAGMPLLGGETAEHPGVMEPTAVDLAGAAMGVVEANAVLGPDRVRAGDLVIGLSSPNLRSNGFSLVRAVMQDDVEAHAATLLEPSVIYSPSIASSASILKAAAHITGGGLAGNVARVLPAGLGATIDTTSWERPAVFDLIQSYGVAEEEMRKTFNLGIGFVVIVDPEPDLSSLDHNPTVIGTVHPGAGVNLV